MATTYRESRVKTLTGAVPCADDGLGLLEGELHPDRTVVRENGADDLALGALGPRGQENKVEQAGGKRRGKGAPRERMARVIGEVVEMSVQRGRHVSGRAAGGVEVAAHNRQHRQLPTVPGPFLPADGEEQTELAKQT